MLQTEWYKLKASYVVPELCFAPGKGLGEEGGSAEMPEEGMAWEE